MLNAIDVFAFGTLIISIVIFVCVAVKVKGYKRKPCTIHENSAHQQDDIFNISSQVQNQEQWQTRDAHLTIDHISIMNQMNKPAYDDAPPSYDEVMKTSLQNNGQTSTVEIPPPPHSQVVIVIPPTATSTSQ